MKEYNKNRWALHICYFGVREPLVQTQVLTYLREIGKGHTNEPKSGDDPEVLAEASTRNGFDVSLLTFEPAREAADIAEFIQIKARLAAEGIEWNWLPYHKRLSAIATAWDVFRGALFICRRVEGFDILHARSHVPMLMAALARKFLRTKPKLLFDIRGFMPEEYADAGVWPEHGSLFRGAKRVERWLMKEADGFVVLTQKAREILFPSDKVQGTSDNETRLDRISKIQDAELGTRPVEVIPCCVDFDRRFSGEPRKLRDQYRRELDMDRRFVMVHLGALGGLYLVKEIADALAASRKRDPLTFALIITQSNKDLIEPLLLERSFTTGDYFIGRVRPEEVEGYLYASDVGLSIVKATFATQSRSPTKIPEYLACGLPIIANSGVGDVDEMITRNRVGALIDEFTDDAYVKALREIEELGDISERCREVARREFDLETVGGVRYRRLYQKLLE